MQLKAYSTRISNDSIQLALLLNTGQHALLLERGPAAFVVRVLQLC